MKTAYIGCRTTRERNARGKGLKVCRVMDDGTFSEIQLIENMENPSYQCIDRNKEFLYTVHGDKYEVSAFRIQKDGRLEYLNTVGNVGKNPVFITTDSTNHFLYAASLQGGCVNVLKRRENGQAEEPFYKAHLPGKTEEGLSHAHQCLWDRKEHYLFVPAQGRRIGYGEVNVFRKKEDGTLEKTDCFFARELDEPRHGAIHPNNRFYYVVNERGNSVTFCLFDEEKGTLEAKQIVQALPETYVGEGQASALLVHPSGRFLYESNRIHDSITIYSIDQNTGYLKRTGNVSCLGKTPRFMTFTPDESELAVANEDSDDIRFFRVNDKTGELTYMDKVFYTESPVCITYLEQPDWQEEKTFLPEAEIYQKGRNEMEKNYLKGVIDTHVHSWPDVRERKMSDMELMEAGVSRGVRGIVIKSHQMPTAARAAIINKMKEEKYPESSFQMFGGVTLNYAVGGLNPNAVETALKIGGKIVWLPTFDSAYTMKRKGASGGIVCGANGKIAEAMKPILQLVKDYDAAIATSHISPEEIFIVAETARNMGIKKIIISHPESNLVGMTLEQQKRLVKDYHVFLEHCYAQPMGDGTYKKNMEDNLIAVREIGAANTIIATDAGQMQNPYWYESLSESIQYLEEHGVSQEEIDQMTRKNPAFVLGIEE